MKKTLFLMILLSMFGVMLIAQQTNPQAAQEPRLGADGIYRDTQEIRIDVNAMAPVSGFYKIKADTFFVSGKYRFVLNDKIVQENSEVLLNKWLKESK